MKTNGGAGGRLILANDRLTYMTNRRDGAAMGATVTNRNHGDTHPQCPCPAPCEMSHYQLSGEA